MGVVLPYVPQAWVDNVTPADAAHMLVLENGLATAVRKPTGLLDGEIPVWDNAAGGWERSSVKHPQWTNADVAAGAAIAWSKIAPAVTNVDVVNFAGIAASKLAGITALDNAVNVGAANTDLASPGAASSTYWAISNGGGTLRSIAAPTGTTTNGVRLVIRNGSTPVTLKHQLAGGAGAKLYLRTINDVILAPSEIIEFVFNSVDWVEVGRDQQSITKLDEQTIAAGNGAMSLTVPTYAKDKIMRVTGVVRSAGAVSSEQGIIRLNHDNASAAYTLYGETFSGAGAAAFTNAGTSYFGLGNGSITGASAGAGVFSLIEFVITPRGYGGTSYNMISGTILSLTSPLFSKFAGYWATAADLTSIQVEGFSSSLLQQGSKLLLEVSI